MTVPLLEWEAPGPYRVAFTTREGGISEGPFASLNLGIKTADEPSRVLENRRRACAAAGADGEAATMAWQVHGAGVAEARGGGVLTGDVTWDRCDGLWSATPGRAMMLLTADCLPIAICRTDSRPALALLHAGWRGLLAGIAEAGTRALGSGRLAAAVGPGIGPCCYDVRKDVAEPFRRVFGDEIVRHDRLDLPAAAERALRAAGCETVERVDGCTSCQPERFFSHRRDRGRTGRQGVLGYVA